jgi:two-component system torCAD operon response regulator TorR
LRILVVEDEPLTRATLVGILSRDGHDVRQASDVTACRAALRAQPADIVLLDIGLPGEDGLGYARELHAQANCGVIMVSQEAAVETRVAALNDGADDYLTKPVHPDELRARVQSVARRRGLASHLEFGSLSIDPASRQARYDGAALALTKGEFDLIVCLAEAKGRIVSREQLSRLVARKEGDLRSVDALVSRLRRKLAEVGGGELIATAPGFGYRLAAAPEPP